MANNLSIVSDGGAGIFECPACKQTIDASAKLCRFCSSRIDPVAAQVAAEKMARINRACSDASFLRTAATAVPVFFGVMFIPFMLWAGAGALYFLALAIPFLTIRWWVRFYDIRTNDTDFRRAKTAVIVISILVLPYVARIVWGFVAAHR